ncbi:alpha/beta hydrolase, partial [Rhizobium phaseoli]
WGSFLVDAGEAGHINADSGHGPWPEGTMVFAQFLSRLSAD